MCAYRQKGMRNILIETAQEAKCLVLKFKQFHHFTKSFNTCQYLRHVTGSVDIESVRTPQWSTSAEALNSPSRVSAFIASQISVKYY